MVPARRISSHSSPANPLTDALPISMILRTPRFGVEDAERLSREHFGFIGRATPLTSERDQNFLLDDGSKRIVLKIANAAEERSMLEAQQAALAHLSSLITTTARVVAALDGSSLTEVADADGERHLLWAITWLPGAPFAVANRRSPQLFEDPSGFLLGPGERARHCRSTSSAHSGRGARSRDRSPRARVRSRNGAIARPSTAHRGSR
jgi:hypothetical protein